MDRCPRPARRARIRARPGCSTGRPGTAGVRPRAAARRPRACRDSAVARPQAGRRLPRGRRNPVVARSRERPPRPTGRRDPVVARIQARPGSPTEGRGAEEAQTRTVLGRPRGCRAVAWRCPVPAAARPARSASLPVLAASVPVRAAPRPVSTATGPGQEERSPGESSRGKSSLVPEARGGPGERSKAAGRLRPRPPTSAGSSGSAAPDRGASARFGVLSPVRPLGRDHPPTEAAHHTVRTWADPRGRRTHTPGTSCSVLSRRPFPVRPNIVPSVGGERGWSPDTGPVPWSPPGGFRPGQRPWQYGLRLVLHAYASPDGVTGASQAGGRIDQAGRHVVPRGAGGGGAIGQGAFAFGGHVDHQLADHFVAFRAYLGGEFREAAVQPVHGLVQRRRGERLQ